MTLYRLKLKSKFILYELFGLLILFTIILISVVNERLIETSITIILFFIYRKLYSKQYHSSNLLLCGLISLIVFTIVSYIEVSLSVSILYSVIITFCITTISYFVRDYLDSKNEINKHKNKCLENLTLEEMLDLFPDIKRDIILIVYGYLHRDRSLSAYAYSSSKNISEPLMYKYLKKVKDAFKNLGN